MRSFAAISFIATLALSAFSGVVASAEAHHGLAPRCDSCPSVPATGHTSAVGVLVDLQAKINPHVTAIVNLNVDAVAQADVHLKEIHIAIDGAVKACTGLVGKASAEILASVDASVVVTVAVFAQLLGSIIIAVVTACAKLVVLVHGDISICGPFFASVGADLAALVKICIQLVPGCLSILVSVLVGVVASIKLCAFADLLAVLNISL